ncbi:sigma-70 family RNA polymerase sigma factor [uncultured Acetobacteroides sp.]|uniref:RNA polymerase sigma factor n=1 Tax=uncultured Acetobacteroides sp. TaxID=1760811 RepID=UPI0029F57C81|nr:sigma-70 family RNA polymerase sigma factor [uncultured Acetobacteroides sp.]
MLNINSTTIRNRLLRVALRLLGSKDDAEDVAQEVLLKLYQRSDIGELKSVEAYAVTMARNLCLDIKRRSSCHRTVEIEQAANRHDGQTPHTSLERADSYGFVRQTMEELKDTYKMVIHLRDIEELEFDEIATIMDMSENQVRVTLSRARKKLRDALVNSKNFEDGTIGRAAEQVF